MKTTSVYQRLAEANGATIVEKIELSCWIARSPDGFLIVDGAFSIEEAARRYCEDMDLTPATPDAILVRVLAAYRGYSALPAFNEGYRAYHLYGATRCNPYANGCSAQTQAWENGASAARLYQGALAHLDANPVDAVPETASPYWLERLIRIGGGR